jgi:hypothetical protein
MHPRAAGRNDYSIQAMFLDGILDDSLTLAGTAILEIRRISRLRKFADGFYHCLHVDHGRDIRSSVADKDTDSCH